MISIVTFFWLQCRKNETVTLDRTGLIWMGVDKSDVPATDC